MFKVESIAIIHTMASPAQCHTHNGLPRSHALPAHTLTRPPVKSQPHTHEAASEGHARVTVRTSVAAPQAREARGTRARAAWSRSGLPDLSVRRRELLERCQVFSAHRGARFLQHFGKMPLQVRARVSKRLCFAQRTPVRPRVACRRLRHFCVRAHFAVEEHSLDCGWSIGVFEDTNSERAEH